MKTMLRFVAILAIAALAGCSGTGASAGPATYEVDVRNRTDQPIVAQIVAPLDGAPHVLRESRLGPGDRAQLLVQVNSSHRVGVRADFAGNAAYPAVMDVYPGLTVVNVSRTEQGATGQIHLEQVPRP